jgi:hypothetical protein
VDKFPGDLTDEVARLRAEINELKALLKSRPALTQASQGWRMANMTIPAVGAGEIHVGANGDDFYAATSSGVKRILSPAAPIANQANFTSSDISSTPTAAQYNALRADAVATRQYAFDLTTRLRNAGHILI